MLVGDYDTNTLAWNIIDGLARVAIFVFYVWLIGRMKDIKRMFAYHGAEHKTIFEFAPKSKGADDMSALTDEIIAKLLQ